MRRIKKYVKFEKEEYEYSNFDDNFGNITFRENGKHILLFNYADKDLSRLPLALERCISKKFDLENFEKIDYQYSENDLDEIKEILRGLHPYYKNDLWSLAREICYYFGFLTIKSGIHDKLFDISSNRKILLQRNFWGKESDEEKAQELLMNKIKKWHIERLEFLLEHLPFESHLPYLDTPIYCTSKYDPKSIFDDYYDKIVKFVYPANREEPNVKDFVHVLKTQEIIRHMLFWTLDISAPINDLSTIKRAWLFTNIFKDEAEYYMINITKFLFFGVVNENETDSLNNDKFDMAVNLLYDKVTNNSYNFQTETNNIPEDIKKALYDAKECVDGFYKKGDLEIYEITDLRQLLFLEIMSMINLNNKIKKCKNCDRYFVITNLNSEYCDRLDEKEKKPCSVVGPTRSYNTKVKSDRPLQLYNRAYKTHYARYEKKKKTSKKDEVELWNNFKSWNEEAKNRLEKVRAGDLNIDEFEVWLKQ